METKEFIEKYCRNCSEECEKGMVKTASSIYCVDRDIRANKQDNNEIKIDILGSTYTIYKNVTEEEQPCLKKTYGSCDYCSKRIYISEDTAKQTEDSMGNLQEFEKKVIRHEIIHAFLVESGLRENSNRSSSWAVNEEMIDWIALQSTKIYKVFKELDIL